MNLWFATNNAHKKEELSACLRVNALTCDLPEITIKIPSQEGILFDPTETCGNFYENSLLKARELFKILSENKNTALYPIIADDSGLCVDALGGRPGILSARYGTKNGIKPGSNEQNMMLLDELADSKKRSARFVCAMTVLYSYERFIVVQETIEGEIVEKNKIKGDRGFGYDPVFFIPQMGRTLAELTTEEKNKISHRGKAVKSIFKHIYA